MTLYVLCKEVVFSCLKFYLQTQLIHCILIHRFDFYISTLFIENFDCLKNGFHRRLVGDETDTCVLYSLPHPYSERNYSWDSLQAKRCVVEEDSLQAQGIVCNGGLVASPRDCVQWRARCKSKGLCWIVCSGGLVASSRVVVCTGWELLH